MYVFIYIGLQYRSTYWIKKCYLC